MGEYAYLDADRIKIGTCEDMYYLRPEQATSVRPDVPGNVDPITDREHLRFRFPFPDEDGIAPGEFDDALRKLIVPNIGPAACDDGLWCKCPVPSIAIVQQKWLTGGVLCLVCECTVCHARFRLPTLAQVAPVVKACIAAGKAALAAKDSGQVDFWAQVADRILLGYRGQTIPPVSGQPKPKVTLAIVRDVPPPAEPVAPAPQTELGIGDTYLSDQAGGNPHGWRVRRYADCVYFQDLAHAGQRGKSGPRFTLEHDRTDAGAWAFCRELIEADREATLTAAQVRTALEAFAKEAPGRTWSVAPVAGVKIELPIAVLKARAALAAKKAKPLTVECADNITAIVTPGVSVRLVSPLVGNLRKPRGCDLTYQPGDVAEYGSYNRSYMGIVTNIGPKTVTIFHDGDNTMLSVETFARRNWDGIEPKCKQNADWCD